MLAYTPATPRQNLAAQHPSRATRPGDDFFAYATKRWLDSVASPVGFSNVVYEKTYARMEQRVDVTIREAIGQRAAINAHEPRAQIGVAPAVSQ